MRVSSLRLAAQVARARRRPTSPVRAATPSATTPATLSSVAQALAARPRGLVVVVALAAAVAVHAGVGGATQGIQPQKKQAQTSTTALAVQESAPLPEEPAPPPPPPPAPTKSTTQAVPSTPTNATTTPMQEAGPSLLPGLAAGSGGLGIAGASVGAASTTALATTTPTATATPTPAQTAARPLTRSPPRYPPRAQRDGVGGFVVVEVHVGSDGAVVDARVVESQPPGVFDDAALESVRRWTFAPARSDGAPVASRLRQTLRFTLEQR